ncbi:MAG: hypothetical protein K0R65_2565 [Crocinitomicaceae bacterium]|jgi:NADPH2:quinone reductase|nr:hypothetical protein [Crocinitomicaceae bacterium]
MKSEAFFLSSYGDSDKAFSLKGFDVPQPKPGEVLIEVEAFGLNYADVMARRKMYREAPPLPCVLGYEVVGKVAAAGDESKTNLIGKRVVAFTRFGGYAKHVCTSESAIAEIGELEADKALAIATQYVTAFYMASYLAPIHKGEKVLIHAAAGGVGTALIQLAKRQGAVVYAKVSSEEKCRYVRSIGADFAVDYSKGDYAKQLEHKKFDAIFNPVAGSTFKKDRALLAHGGKLFLYGGSEMLSGRFGIFSTLNFLRKMGLLIPVGLMMGSRSLLGVNMLKIADNNPETLKHCLDEVLRLCREGELQLQPGTIFPAAEMAKAHALLESGKSMGKIAVSW